ncbi:MAG: amidohydrolase [Chitinophagaceae bacterium]|jgi:amidohydrolase|nr:amidohydrolase [Chitinophagaceae bacterium]
MKQIFLSISLLAALTASAQQLPATYPQLVKDITPKLVEWRRHFHQNPELSNREFKTGAFIADYLKSIGLDVKTNVAKTGVVAILKGGKPGPVVALRADIDALPVTERTPIPFASKVTTSFNGQQVGVMHACGHDSHTSILMGTATVLKKMQAEVPGTIVFLFQPAEEGAPDNEEGGAALMVKEGVLDNPKVEAVFGLHINSTVPAGQIQYKSGSFMASSDWFRIKVKGKGAHGSKPWQGVDPIATSSLIIEGLQHIVSRQSELTKAPVVISVGSIHSGVRNNIIPEDCEMLGTIRTLDSKMQQEVHERIRNTVQHIAAANGATAEVMIDTKTLVTYNDPELVKKTLPFLETAAGKGNVVERDWDTGAEDFSFYGAKVPAFFFYLGGMPKGQDPLKAAPHHTPDFYIDESGFDLGVKAFCQLVFDYAKSKK